MGLFGSSSKSSSTSVGTTDQARVAFGKGSTITEPGAVTVGQKAVLKTGGIDLTEATTGNITFGDGGAALAAAQEGWQATILGLNQASADALKTVTAQQSQSQEALASQLLNSILPPVTALAESKQTDGAALLWKYGLWLGLAALVVWAIKLLR